MRLSSRYDSRAFRQRLRRWGIRPCILQRHGQLHRRGHRPDQAGYGLRYTVERTFAWLGSFRRLVVR